MIGDTPFAGVDLRSASITDLNNIGFAFWLRGDYMAARRMYQLALSHGRDSIVLNNLGMVAERLGEYTAAVDLYQQALSVMPEDGGPRGLPALRARILNNLGVSLTLGGDTAAGDTCLREALAIRQQLGGKDGPDYAVTLRNLGLVLQRQHRPEDARRHIEQGRDLLARKGMKGAEYGRTMQILGELLADTGDDNAAIAAFESALDIRSVALGADHPETAVTLRSLASTLHRKGRRAEACEALRSALPVFERHMGPDHPWTIQLRADSKDCIPDVSACAGGS